MYKYVCMWRVAIDMGGNDIKCEGVALVLDCQLGWMAFGDLHRALVMGSFAAPAVVGHAPETIQKGVSCLPYTQKGRPLTAKAGC